MAVAPHLRSPHSQQGAVGEVVGAEEEAGAPASYLFPERLERKGTCLDIERRNRY